MSANVSQDTLGNTVTKVSPPVITISNNLIKNVDQSQVPFCNYPRP